MKARGDEVTPISAGADIAFSGPFGTLTSEVIRMAAMKLGARSLAAVAMAWLGLAPGCYSMTPHRAEVAKKATPHDCTATIEEVFARSGFVQVPTPPKLSMLFTARTSGPYSSFLSTNAGVGVTVRQKAGDQGVCQVTIEALSPDVNCPGSMNGPSGTLNCQRQGSPIEPAVWSSSGGPATLLPCPTVPQPTCELTYAPGEENDRAVDELARRVQVALGGAGEVH
jgi:hypothetical protein